MSPSKFLGERKLLIKPSPEPGESWPGYLLRIATLNHLERGLVDLAKLIGAHPQALIASDPEVVLCKLGIRSGVASSRGLVEVKTGSVPLRNASRSTMARICPECLRESTNKHVRADWDFALQVQCRTHRTLLIDKCPSCLSPISHLRHKLLRCNCGVEWVSLSSKTGDHDIHHVYELLGLQDRDDDLPPTFGASSHAEVLAFRLCRRLLLLQEAVSQESKKRRPRETVAFMSAEELMKVRQVLSGWPHKLYHLLDSYRSMFGSSPIRWIVDKNLPNSKLPIQIRSALAQWAIDIRRTIKPGKKSLALVQRSDTEHVGIGYVLVATGCSYKTARYWIDCGRLGQYQASKQSGGRLRFQLDKKYVQRAVQISKSSSSVGEMAANLGTTRAVLRQFVRAGLLYAIPYGRATYNFRLHPSEVYSLANRILSCARLRRELFEEHLIFSSAMARFSERQPVAIERFINALIQGTISLSKVSPHVVALDELLVERASLERWEKGGML